jgi:hypothetical protein
VRMRFAIGMHMQTVSSGSIATRRRGQMPRQSIL